MIIDTDKLSDDELLMYGNLLSDRFKTNSKGEWTKNKRNKNVRLDISKYTSNFKLDVKFAECDEFSFYGEFSRYHNNGTKNDERRMFKSFKNFPDKCDVLNMTNYNIDIVDFLPVARLYIFYKSKIKQIKYPFPKHVEELNLDYNYLESFENFPETVDTLKLSFSKFKSLKGIPFINKELTIDKNNSDLKDFDGIKGTFKKINLHRLSSLKTLPYISKEAKEVNLVKCSNLFNLDTILNIESSKCIIWINKCYKVDLYRLFNSKYKVQIADDLYMPYRLIYEWCNSNRKEVRKMSRSEFEIKTIGIVIENDYGIETFTLHTKEAKEALHKILKSLNIIDKFNL